MSFRYISMAPKRGDGICISFCGLWHRIPVTKSEGFSLCGMSVTEFVCFLKAARKSADTLRNAFDPFFLLAQFFFAESQEGPPFQLSLSSSMRR